MAQKRAYRFRRWGLGGGFFFRIEMLLLSRNRPLREFICRNYRNDVRYGARVRGNQIENFNFIVAGLPFARVEFIIWLPS